MGGQAVYAQYGCGLCAPAGWRNFDSSPTLRLQRLPAVGRLVRIPGHPVFPRAVEYGDIVKGLPLAPGSCAGIYASHVLEHVALDDFRTALRNTLKYLRPGGIFRLLVPDFEAMARAYLQSPDPGACLALLSTAQLGSTSRPRGVRGFLRQWLGSDFHLWMWDYKAMAAELESAGFRGIRRAEVGDSGDSAFDAVEDARRWEGSVAVHCVR
jgi:SAM-dependent methyltransferase